MNSFIYYNPTRLIFGAKTVDKLGDYIPKKARVLMLFGGGSAKKNGAYKAAKKMLGKRKSFEFWGIEPNPEYETCMKAVALVRKALGIRTVFNLLGPLVNPALPRYQLLGVARLGQLRLYDGALRRLGTGYGLVNSADGYDEVSLTGRFKLLTRDREVLLEPADLGFEPVAPQCLSGGTSRSEARAVFDAVLDGSAPRPQRDVVAANAGLALSLARPDLSLADCIATAREALESGAALRTFRRFVELNS